MSDLDFTVTNAGSNNQKFDLKFETDLGGCDDRNLNQNMSERMIWIQKFTLEPDMYTFHVHRKVSEENLTPEEKLFLTSQEDEHYHFRIASASKFEFKEISYEDATSLTQEIDQKFEEMKLSNLGDDGVIQM